MKENRVLYVHALAALLRFVFLQNNSAGWVLQGDRAVHMYIVYLEHYTNSKFGPILHNSRKYGPTSW